MKNAFYFILKTLFMLKIFKMKFRIKQENYFSPKVMQKTGQED